MDRICPLCNALTQNNYLCPLCDEAMVDKGRIQDYLDSYSAEMPIEDNGLFCIHIFFCSRCNDIRKMKVKKI